ncbi:hypothetical protein LEP1GSC199_3794 [Leptospira vanthielii serovar Holland str. Waz Holland = ATCC 700522]|uniref:Uncharacterized protein n=1 Tax=Leptospira vanthielii serovar Holland str. Waz Holland = ATCC 700522 TaxID=1218591 RepID=N1W7U9_9LEPT|nr:hypothetical protein LEP1GSC199_3794 [Leptospira vanthielii serovar Holland str. Waz Holland = ATCC 700522]
MRTFQEKKRGSADLDFGFNACVVEGTYWAAGLVPHPNQGGDSIFTKNPFPTTPKNLEPNRKDFT